MKAKRLSWQDGFASPADRRLAYWDMMLFDAGWFARFIPILAAWMRSLSVWATPPPINYAAPKGEG